MNVTAKLDDLYTLPDFRRRGVARALMDAVTDWARTGAVRYVFWYANQREAGKAYQAIGDTGPPRPARKASTSKWIAGGIPCSSPASSLQDRPG
ncbi:GNAT family N-acetyltransferase [Deinococcus antarcticus]|uniref:GNAT family N-acetyltransferase n=1 Tax=Deinococcus antarcticus TaxID=1298767 RepID=A0ABV8A3H8_9DEIO